MTFMTSIASAIANTITITITATTVIRSRSRRRSCQDHVHEHKIKIAISMEIFFQDQKHVHDHEHGHYSDHEHVRDHNNNNNCYIAGVFPATTRPFIGQFMVTWHLTMKLFPAKRHERATLRKLWRQPGNSSLLPAKCWPLLQYLFSTGLNRFCYITNPSMTGPSGNSEFCFPRISMFPSTSSRETLRFSGNKFHCSPRDQSLSVYYNNVQISKPITFVLGITDRTSASSWRRCRGWQCSHLWNNKW